MTLLELLESRIWTCVEDAQSSSNIKLGENDSIHAPLRLG